MNRLKVVMLIVLIASFTGCSTIRGIFGKKASAEAKQASKIEQIDDKIATNNEDKIIQISSFSYGIQYSLNKVTNPEPSVIIAKDLNTRILTLSGNPLLEEIKRMELLVDNLTSTNIALIKKGQTDLANKDKEVVKLQNESNKLLDEKDTEVKKYMLLAKDTALRADTAQAELKKFTGWFGLSAIYQGFKQLFTTSIWFIVIFIILFIVLRILSTTNPIAAAIFGVFNLIGSWFISALKYITPKAASAAGYVGKEAYDLTKQTLTKVVDAVEVAKTKGVDTSVITVEAGQTMNSNNKEIVNNIKKDLNYKQ
jgi:hypothetical protein